MNACEVAMSKPKMVLLIILAIILADFAIENTQPHPDIKFFKYTVGNLPTYLLAFVSLALGMVIGWTAHALRIRKKRRAAAAQASPQEEQ